MRRLIPILALVVALMACGPTPSQDTAARRTPPPIPQPSVPAAASCHYSTEATAALPDSRCTPGVADPRVTPDNLASTICRSGYTATVRPPTSYTGPLKVRLMRSYAAGGAATEYELDHLISLELGGSPTDPGNLWPEPGASPNLKDRVENAAHATLCPHHGEHPPVNPATGRPWTLVEVQQAIATDWPRLGAELGAIPVMVE